MDILDSVNHLYQSELSNGARDLPIHQALPLRYPEKTDFCQLDDHDSFDRYDNNLPCNECNNNIASLAGHISGVFRQKLNVEIENFRASVNEIVDEQQLNIRSVFNLPQDIDAAQEVPMHMFSRSSSADNITSDYQLVVDSTKRNDHMSVVESPASTFNSYGASDSDQGYPNFAPSDLHSQRDVENAKIDRLLLKLMTATLAIANTLRREEYKVL